MAKRTRTMAVSGSARGRAARPLAGTVALVAGATRSSGRGIARAFGEAGATVYCTGRSAQGRPSAYNRPETIDETVGIVERAGGRAVALRVDHTNESELRGLIRRITRDEGRLDALTLSIAGEDPTLAWREPLDRVTLDGLSALIRQAVLSHVLTVKHALPLMKRTKRGGLIVEVTEGDTLVGGYSLAHRLVKQSLKLLVFNYAEELRPYRIAAVAVTPGFLRSEAMLEHFGVTEENWRDGASQDDNFAESESPVYLGRGIAALAADARKLDYSGHITSSWELAARYDVADADGSRHDWGAHFRKIAHGFEELRDEYRREARLLESIAARARAYASS